MTKKLRGTVQRLGLEGGLWALLTADGRSVELIDAPAAIQRAGLTVEVEGDGAGAEVTVGMLGDALRVRSFRVVKLP